MPKSAPDILPLPPSIDMPPMTVIAMAFSSYALPDDVELMEPIRELSMIAATDIASPSRVNARIFILSVLMPESLVAFSFEPAAYIWRPSFVYLDMNQNRRNIKA